VYPVRPVRFSRACKMNSGSGLQRVWCRFSVPLDISYARTGHNAQGATIASPVHVDMVFVVVFVGGKVPSSLIYTMLSRATDVGLMDLARNRHGHVFDLSHAKPDPRALAWYTRKLNAYSPLSSVLEAFDGNDDS
jgi:hypothetical protein